MAYSKNDFSNRQDLLDPNEFIQLASLELDQNKCLTVTVVTSEYEKKSIIINCAYNVRYLI